jgi:hypothetical protein
MERYMLVYILSSGRMETASWQTAIQVFARVDRPGG